MLYKSSILEECIAPSDMLLFYVEHFLDANGMKILGMELLWIKEQEILSIVPNFFVD